MIPVKIIDDCDKQEVPKKMDANNNDGEIRNFYRGKSILITGSTGFMGKVLVHKLLSDCPIKKYVKV